MSTRREQDWATAKSLVRAWLTEKDVALTGVNGEASRSTVNRFKLDLERRVVDAIADERERCCAVLCRWCGDPSYRLVWHHEEWRHYRNSDNHVEYCDAAAIRRDSTGEGGS